MPPVLQFNRPAIAARFEQAAAYLGIAGGFDGFCAYVDDLNAALGIPGALSEIGVTDPDIDALVASALCDPSCAGNPVELTPDNLKPLLMACL